MRRRVNAASVAILLAIVSPAIAGSRTEALARCKGIQDGIQRRDCFRSLNGKTKEAPPVPLVQDPRAGDNPATALTIDHPSAAVGQPLCEDRDTLADVCGGHACLKSGERDYHRLPNNTRERPSTGFRTLSNRFSFPPNRQGASYRSLSAGRKGRLYDRDQSLEDRLAADSSATKLLKPYAEYRQQALQDCSKTN